MSTRQHLPVECWCGQSWDLRNQPPRLWDLDELICSNCGDDLVCEGFIWCSDCLEAEYS